MTLRDAAGVEFATVATRSLGGGFHGVVLTWRAPESIPASSDAGLADFAQALQEARRLGALVVQSRVVSQQADLAPGVVAARADWHRSVLRALGFKPGTGRLEFRTPLERALAACQGKPPVPGLEWDGVPSEPGEAIERAGRVLRAAAVGDPDSDPEDDAVAFLLARRDEPDLLLSSAAIQVGRLEGRDVAIVACSVKPATGWCSLYYAGVVPSQRGRGLGLELMAHGLRLMHGMGGRVYHDGTGSENRAALALFRRIQAEPYRAMEQWSLDVTESLPEA